MLVSVAMPSWLRLLHARRAALALPLALLAFCAAASATFAHFQSATLPSIPADPGPLTRSLADFAYPDQHAQIVAKRSLRGHVWIADFMYTTCTSACPLITSRLVTVQRRLPDAALRFVSFSVDPERDSVSELAKYAARWVAAETRWHLLRPDRASLSALVAGLGLALEQENADILHTNRLFLIDALGNVDSTYDSNDDDALNRLVSRGRELLGEPTQDSPLSGSGTELFASLGCAGCHANTQLAPPLAGLFGSYVMLERGGSVLANDDYVRESIADPSSKVVSGYPNSMPNYGPLLSSEQVQSLVDYVRSLPALSNVQAVASETDPVCHMAVRVTDQTPHAEYQGKVYHFCSPACSERFAANPPKYLPAREAEP
jgi:cytochrome oxidase Cu insertion factor (SCO1/SenC/PrrC family)/YHS domain-containing protein/mono/diheme cytochrome c family protein